MITNIMRKKQIESFFDKDRPVMMKYYDLVQSDLTETKLLNRLYKLVEEDKDFFDPYIVIAEILEGKGKKEEAHTVLRKAYEGTLGLIVDAKGRWPKEMIWGYLENRHIMRALENYAISCWQMGKIEEALLIFKKLLSVNPNDNQGVRYNILAIRLGLSLEEYEEPFFTFKDGNFMGLDAFKIHQWFEKHVSQFPDDFKAWSENVNNY